MQPPWKTVRSFLKKLEVETAYDSGLLLLLVFTQGNTNSKRYMHPYVDCSIIYNSQDTEAAQVSTDKWTRRGIDTQWSITQP